MDTITFFYYRHRTKDSVSMVELFGLGETANKSFHLKVKKGDAFAFADLKDADKSSIRKFTPNPPENMVVKTITLEPNLEIEDGIRKVFLEEA